MIDQTLTLPNGRTLKNRIVKSAMSEALADAQNNPSQGQIDLFRRWSNGGAAMLITGNTPVDRWHLEHAGNFVLDPLSDLDQVARLTEAAKSGDAVVLAQLAHAGRQTPQAVNPAPTSISTEDMDLSGYGAPQQATDADLEAVIKKFSRSAQLAQQAGFDGVQIHGAHGYLLSSALSPRINTRDDHWGGPLENRARLLLSVVRAVRAVVVPEFIVAVKLNSSDFQKGGFSHEESVLVAQMLEAEGVDFIEISGGTFETPTAYQHASQKESTKTREGYFLEYAKAIKAAITIPLMVTGGFRSVEVMNGALQRAETDLIGLGRPFIIDPEFPTKLLSGVLNMAPAIEREFPPASELPRGAVLNWFCEQLSLLGRVGDTNLELSIEEGHARYLEFIQVATDAFLRARTEMGLRRPGS
ncbi:NADH:flavin oxidoreductase/NADH oxidase family protein [Phaeobacter sp. NW0010-22]|uniref:NADH:flavin oxidoreductase/NADH oxidase family protein n=1 Tax=Phaeobacter sp. NW0010-22 TaxID=3135907 RepID=UPI00310B0F84